MSRRTKIVATIGPATDSPEMMEAALRAGIDVARINFSHGGEEHLDRIARFRAAAKKVGKFAAVLADLPGPALVVVAGTVTQAAAPLFAGLLAWMVFGERINAATWAAILAVIAGVAIMVSASFSGEVSPLGDGLALVITIMFSAAIVITRHHPEVRMMPAVCLGTAMACVHAPQPARRVEDLVARRRHIVHVAGGREHARRRLEATVVCEGHPEGGQVIRFGHRVT